MRELFSKWWKGEFVPYKNDPNAEIVFIGGYKQRHWTSDAAHKIWGFLKVEWKWVTGFFLTSIGLLMTYIHLF